jgi:hypothetical protein
MIQIKNIFNNRESVSKREEETTENNVVSSASSSQPHDQHSNRRRGRESGHRNSQSRTTITASANEQQYVVPPASKAVLDNLIHLRLRGTKGLSNHDECVLCMDKFQVNDVVTALPCGHMNHSNCIVDWLERRGNCPTCRYELPNDELDDISEDIEKGDLDRHYHHQALSSKLVYSPLLGSAATPEICPEIDTLERIFTAIKEKECRSSDNYSLILKKALRMKVKMEYN